MKKSSRIALVIVSVAAGIIIGFFGLLYCMSRALNKAFKDIKIEELFTISDEAVEPEIVERENEEAIDA